MNSTESKNSIKGLFQDREMSMKSQEEQLAMFGSLCLALANALEAEEKGDRELCEKLIALSETNAASLMCDKFFTLVGATLTEISWLRYSESSEVFIQEKFKEHASVLIKGASIVKGKSDRHNRPDAWIELDSELIPVEVKNEAFGEKALKQLNRYVSFFGCKRGIAVAPKLSIDLPDNIIFVSTREILKADAEARK